MTPTKYYLNKVGIKRKNMKIQCREWNCSRNTVHMYEIITINLSWLLMYAN
jgi:hypothetical protein